jgi:hypothetical protein
MLCAFETSHADETLHCGPEDRSEEHVEQIICYLLFPFFVLSVLFCGYSSPLLWQSSNRHRFSRKIYSRIWKILIL